jgi:hypothetical protein
MAGNESTKRSASEQRGLSPASAKSAAGALQRAALALGAIHKSMPSLVCSSSAAEVERQALLIAEAVRSVGVTIDDTIALLGGPLERTDEFLTFCSTHAGRPGRE